MSKSKTITLKGTEITIFHIEKDDYISLTDMARFKNAETTGLVISNWLSTRYTVEFIGLRKTIKNPNLNITEFSNIKNESGSNGFVLSTKQCLSSLNFIN